MEYNNKPKLYQRIAIGGACILALAGCSNKTEDLSDRLGDQPRMEQKQVVNDNSIQFKGLIGLRDALEIIKKDGYTPNGEPTMEQKQTFTGLRDLRDALQEIIKENNYTSNSEPKIKEKQGLGDKIYNMLDSYKSKPIFDIVESTERNKVAIYDLEEGTYKITLERDNNLKTTDSHADRIFKADPSIGRHKTYNLANILSKRFPIEANKRDGAYSDKAFPQYVVKNIEYKKK